MYLTEYIFLISLSLILYAYIGYPLVLFIAYSAAQVRRDVHYLWGREDRRAASLAALATPPVTVIVAAYNEEANIRRRIANLHALDYPTDSLDVVIVSDGSEDGTNEILSGFEDPRLKTVFLPRRMGKATALNAGVAEAKGDVLVFSDASTLMDPDAVHRLLRHFTDPEVGVVCGALRFQASEESQQTEGVYWKYESMLRLMESRLGATLTASGALYAIRRECYATLPAATMIDDFIVPMNARRMGYEVLYDPEATAVEVGAASVAGEFTRRVRLAIGSFRAAPQLLRVPMNGFTFFAFVSHKLLRWVLPFLLLCLLATNTLLLGRSLYRYCFLAQFLFYAWAVVGWLLKDRLRGVRYALLGYFLLAMNAAFLVGFFRAFGGQKEASWQRVE